MASEIAFQALEGLPPESLVLDPMCGSGVVVRRAMDCGYQALGLDIDPLAVLMAKVWTTRVASTIHDSFGLELVDQAEKLLGTRIELPWIDGCQETVDYIDFWFHPLQQQKIRALLAASRRLRGQKANLAKVALSRIIITKTRGASLAADVSHSRPHRVRTVNNFDVFAAFLKSMARILRILRDEPPGGGGRIRRGDARTLRGVKRGSIDAVVTSPPYLNAIDYLRGHKLALVWLGYTTQELRMVKSQGIGASAPYERRMSCRLTEIVSTSSQDKLPAGIERTVMSYVYDMSACLKQTWRVLCPDGYAVYVVSNSVLRGTEVDTAQIIVEVASDAGLQLEDCYIRDIPRQHRYLPPPRPRPTANWPRV